MAGGISGHVSLGLAFFIIGLWHLFNTIKHFSLHPTSFLSLPWFPTPRFRRLEPLTIMLVTAAFITSEIFIAGKPITPGGAIPSANLRHLEHSIIALSFFVYALFSLLLDRTTTTTTISPENNGLLHLLLAAAFGQQLLILHLHSTDHSGVEGQYHWLLQIVTGVSLLTTVIAAGRPRSFLNSFVRDFSVVFQGVWLVVTGVMLWTPRWLPEGCFLRVEEGRDAVVCGGDGELDRAKALVNVEFGMYLIGLSVLTMLFYLVVRRLYPAEELEYRRCGTMYEEEQGDCDVEANQKCPKLCCQV